jgi:hypothetical protein
MEDQMSSPIETIGKAVLFFINPAYAFYKTSEFIYDGVIAANKDRAAQIAAGVPLAGFGCGTYSLNPQVRFVSRQNEELPRPEWVEKKEDENSEYIIGESDCTQIEATVEELREIEKFRELIKSKDLAKMGRLYENKEELGGTALSIVKSAITAALDAHQEISRKKTNSSKSKCGYKEDPDYHGEFCITDSGEIGIKIYIRSSPDNMICE